MFHALVSYQGWPDGAGSISTGRIYVDAEQAPGRLFVKDGKLDISKVSKIPALLVTETGGKGQQFARVAYITSITQGPKETAVQYALDSSIPPVSNADLERLSSQFGLSLNLTHTHWSVHDADLFKILLMNQRRTVIAPKVFSIESAAQPQSDLVSVMMPFSQQFDATYAALKEAVASTGLKCMRADDFWEHHAVIQDIVNLIARARVVICDCSGRNPNVFYEAGIAHTLGKEVLIIAQSKDDVPFDLRHLRFVIYQANKQGLEALSAAVKSRLKTLIG